MKNIHWEEEGANENSFNKITQLKRWSKSTFNTLNQNELYPF